MQNKVIKHRSARSFFTSKIIIGHSFRFLRRFGYFIFFKIIDFYIFQFDKNNSSPFFKNSLRWLSRNNLWSLEKSEAIFSIIIFVIILMGIIIYLIYMSERGIRLSSFMLWRLTCDKVSYPKLWRLFIKEIAKQSSMIPALLTLFSLLPLSKLIS